MSDLTKALKARLIELENQAKQGVIPGELDAYELEQLIGRIKELKLVLKLISANAISEILKGMLNEP